MIWCKVQSQGVPKWFVEFDDLEGGRFTFGRHPSCDVHLSDPHVSSKHLVLFQKFTAQGDPQIGFEEMSSNGTFVNGEKVIAGTKGVLEDGTIIEFPCDDNSRENFRFVLTKLLEPRRQVGNGTGHGTRRFEFSRTSKQADGEKEDDGVRSQSPSSQQHPEEWLELERLQNLLTVETSRLAASIFSNEDIAKERKLPLEPKELELVDCNYKRIIQDILASMRSVATKVSASKTISEDERSGILEELNLDKYSAAFNELCK
mmetsp:Transcript_10003/g.16387  ORF Transcript_10003/g.16387 Transcript_10003/m.16387 type:complete len:260 (-) Transcript_10003:1747-2526(-)